MNGRRHPPLAPPRHRVPWIARHFVEILIVEALAALGCLCWGLATGDWSLIWAALLLAAGALLFYLIVQAHWPQRS